MEFKAGRATDPLWYGVVYYWELAKPNICNRGCVSDRSGILFGA